MTAEPARKKIAILGGGIGALTTACYLTSQKGWDQLYEITVYQLGWRLGGKGATGRQADRNERILEHGLHVWFGWYENAFRTLRAVYDELDRAPGQAIATVEEAFTPRNGVQLLEQIGDEWLPWNLDFPILPGVPGKAEVEPFAWDVLVAVVEFIAQQAEKLLSRHPEDMYPKPEGLGGEILEELGKVVGEVGDALHKSSLHAALQWMKTLAPGAEEARKTGGHKHHHRFIATLLRHFRDWINDQIDAAVRDDPTLRRIWILVDLSCTSVIGFLEDGVNEDGLQAIDDWELKDWLRERGASPDTVDSNFVRALYDCFFGYRDGHIDQPYIAAGAGLGCVMRIGLTYHGSVLYMMNAGMGEIIVAPIYQLLKRRGVKFEFFRKVTGIEPTDDGKNVQRVRMAVQAHVKEGAYDPLYTVNDLPVWPDRPFYDQLVEGDALKAQGINLESRWAEWTDTGEQVLEQGVDFHIVVQGISLAGLHEICAPLADVNHDWRAMLDKMPSMQTFGVQLWFDKALEEMGWTGPVRPAVAAPELMDVWADMSPTIQRESYDYRHEPRSIIYLCGPLPGDMLKRAPSDRQVPEEAWQQVYDLAKEWLERYPGWIWHKSVGPDTGKGLDWNLLFAGAGTTGLARLAEQFFRANIDPPERYVLSPPKWNQLRMHPGKSGFDNLILAGDWTYNTINAGCVEAATISGMMASRAICGCPEKIAGEHFLTG
jgi:uncharacterized protein with NAD-binding domain and iron-sulfur cluster